MSMAFEGTAMADWLRRFGERADTLWLQQMPVVTSGYRRARRRYGYRRFPSRRELTRRALVTFIRRFEEAAPTLALAIADAERAEP